MPLRPTNASRPADDDCISGLIDAGSEVRMELPAAGSAARSLCELSAYRRGALMADVTIASLNIRGIPLTGSRLAARCQAIGAFFEASDADVVCLQEVATWAHLTLLARRMRSFRYVSLRRTVPGPAGDVVTFSRQPVTATAFHRYGPVHAQIPRLARLRARLKGALVTTLEQPVVSVINTHPLANTDGDWSAGSRFEPAHRAQLGALARTVGSVPVPTVVCGDFNVDRDSALLGDFIRQTMLADAFEGRCPPTFRAEYLPAGRRPCCIDFILTTGEVKVSAADVILAGEQPMRGSPGYVSDHVGLRVRLHVLGA
jgi:sphingomyelin phosphodiesterase 2